jgi:hypothetical protein
MLNVKVISNERVKTVKGLAKTIWSNYSPYELQQELQSLWKELSRKIGVEFVPLYKLKKGEVLSCAIFGSGSFSTGRKELEIAKEIKEELGWAPVDYKFIVTNRSKSNARAVFEEFKELGLTYVEVDFSNWYRENYDRNSKSPIKDTRFFYPPGEEAPPNEVIERNFNIRREFDKAMNRAIVKIGNFPTSLSLRGYNFPLFTTFKTLVPAGHQVVIDDTHPADMSYVDPKTKLQLYPGWKSGATGKMKSDGCSLYRGSLIAIDLLDTFADAQKVDTGILYALAPGIKPPSKWSAKAIQTNMKQTEDYFFNALKATGLFPYLWGISVHPEKVQYQAIDGNIVGLNQRLLVVGDQIRAGRDAFGQTLGDLKFIEKLFSTS